MRILFDFFEALANNALYLQIQKKPAKSSLHSKLRKILFQSKCLRLYDWWHKKPPRLNQPSCPLPCLSRNIFLPAAHTAPSASATPLSTLFKARLRAEVKKNQDITSLGQESWSLQKKDAKRGKSHWKYSARSLPVCPRTQSAWCCANYLWVRAGFSCETAPERHHCSTYPEPLTQI